MWAGDSVAYTLDDTVTREAANRGLTVTTVSAPGCGMITGLPMIAPGGNETISWAKTCDQNIPRIETEAVQNARPDVVTWLSYWDSNDRVIGDHVLRFGTDAGDIEFLGLVDQAVGRLTATGARVAFLTAPPTTIGTDASPDPVDVQRTQHLDYLLRRYALEHPATTFVVDLSAMVCPGGPPCPQVVGGVELRPRDGRHFDDAGAAWTAPRVLDALMTTATES